MIMFINGMITLDLSPGRDVIVMTVVYRNETRRSCPQTAMMWLRYSRHNGRICNMYLYHSCWLGYILFM